MTSSETNPTSLPPTETLNPTTTDETETPNDSINGHDSPSQPPSNNDNNQIQNDTDTANASEKRKREDTDAAAAAEQHPLYKTSLCSYFRRYGKSCSHGNACRYAHGEEELRMRPDNTWDPTSKRAKKDIVIEEKEIDEEEENENENEIMMIDAVVGDGVDGDGGGCLDVELSKCLVHLPRKWGPDQLRKFLADQGIIFKSAKKKKGMAVGFVSFERQEQLKNAVEELEGKSIGNNMIKVADVIPRSIDKKIKSAMEAGLDGEAANDDASVLYGSISKAKSARDAVTPLAHMSYAEQLEHKKNSITQMLKKLTRSARKACPNGVSLPEWILKSREIGGLPCTVEGILESPLVNGYRNKCEFSVGHSLQGKPTAGFLLGTFREGVTAVEEPADCPNVSSIARKYASIFQEFLQTSKLPMWNRFKNTGFWRQLTVREGRKPDKSVDVENPEVNIQEVMLIVQVSTAGFEDDTVNGELRNLSLAFTTGAAANSPPLPLTTLVLQDHKGISNVAPADAPMRKLDLQNSDCGTEAEGIGNVAEARIHDHISNLRFSISPTAFFQVNTLAAEKLYSLAGDWAGLGPDTLLFDICCGTGTIGLTLAHRVGMVVGIEMNASAVSDARMNAKINGIKNCKFVCGKAEDVIGSLMKECLNLPDKQGELSDIPETGKEDFIGLDVENTSTIAEVDMTKNSTDKPESIDHSPMVPQFKNVVAIVDPPRNGLHPIVIKVLRTHSCLQRLVYISCNPETLVANAIELCTPSPETVEKGNKDNRGWRRMSNAGLARHRLKSMPVSQPFSPVKAMAVDLFPHTAHCELVMLLER